MVCILGEGDVGVTCLKFNHYPGLGFGGGSCGGAEAGGEKMENLPRQIRIVGKASMFNKSVVMGELVKGAGSGASLADIDS